MKKVILRKGDQEVLSLEYPESDLDFYDVAVVAFQTLLWDQGDWDQWSLWDEHGYDQPLFAEFRREEWFDD